MGVGVRIDETGRWRDANGRYAKPPAAFQAPPAPPQPPRPPAPPEPPRPVGPVDYPPPPPASPPSEPVGAHVPPPPEPEPERNEAAEEPSEAAGEELPPEEPPDWAPESIDDGPPGAESPPPDRPEPVGMSTADLMTQLNVGELWAGLIRLAVTPKGYKAAPVTASECQQYTTALAAVADRYFPTIKAPELILLALVTAGGAKAARANAIPPTTPNRDGEEAPE